MEMPYEFSSKQFYQNLKEDMGYDFDENYWSVVHCFERHNLPRHEEDLAWFARQNDIELYDYDLKGYLMREKNESVPYETLNNINKGGENE